MKNKLIDKVRSIIELIADSGEPLEVRNIALALSLDRSTVGRIVSDLCECNYLRRVDCHRVELGLGMIALGQAAINGTFFPQRAIALHIEEAKKIGVSSALGMVYGRNIIYLNRSETFYTNKVLWHHPLYGSNMALVILAEQYGTEAAFQCLTDRIVNLAPEEKDGQVESIRNRLEFFSTHGYSVESTKSFFNLSFPLRHGNNVLGLSFFSDRRVDANRVDALIAKGSIVREKIRQLLGSSVVSQDTVYKDCNEEYN